MNLLTSYSIRPERVARTLLIVMTILIVLHVVAMQANFNPYWGLKEKYGFHYWQLSFFDLDEEESFGTWFSSGILMFAALLLWQQARILRDAGDKWHRWWFVLGIGFCVLSMDEIAGMHEWMNSMVREVHWTVIGFPIFVAAALAYLPFLWHYRGRTTWLFIISGAIYGGGAIGVEHFTDAEVNSLHYNMWTTLEEGMEMLGVIVFIYAILDYMRVSPANAIRIEVATNSTDT